jgi:uncharacterized protein (TIGR03437 family)
MSFARWVLIAALAASASRAATLGTVTTLDRGSASDIVFDEARNRLYLVNAAASRIEVYSTAPRPAALPEIVTDALPLSAAMSRSGKYLYVASHNGSALNTIDLDTLAVVNRISLPARPEGVAVGADERVLITTIGTGPGNAANTLLLYDPNAAGENSIGNVAITPPPPMPPQLPPPAGRVFLANRSQLIATPDGSLIVGVNASQNTTRVVFVYEVASATVLRSRAVGDVSTVLSIAPDGSKFMLGLRLFDTATLSVLAQQNAANVPFPLSTNITPQGFTQIAQQFNLQQNQGGSVFAPDGSRVFSAFNIAPVQNPPARANITQLLVSDADNLLVDMGIQLPENLAGKMVISSDGGNIFALSESGFLTIPVSAIRRSPVAMLMDTVALLGSDQCGVTEPIRRTNVLIRNMGTGRMTATAQLLGALPTGPAGLGGATGPGGGQVGGGVIILPQPVPGAGLPGTLPAGMTATQAALTQTAPRVRTLVMVDGVDLQLDFNPMVARANGTVSHDFLIQSAEAVNVPSLVRVYQNARDTEARADVAAVAVGISANEGLIEMAADNARQRLYISNAGLNRIEVFDMAAKRFLSPIKVGQLPHSIAITPDGSTLYVANTGGESISIVDLNKMETVGRVKFPPIPFNGNLPILTPTVIAATQRGLQIVMSNGTLWKVVGDEAVPRTISPIIQSATVPAPRTMVATPEGEFALLLDGQGFAYLYDAMTDEYVQRRQVVTAPIQGYYGPVGAGPRGQYFLVNGMVLNQALTPMQSAGSVAVPSGRPGVTTNVPRPIAAVAPIGTTAFARFAQPARLQNNVLLQETAVVEIVNSNTGAVMRSAAALEGHVSTAVGTARVNVNGRTMAVDSSGSIAYMLTTSGLSVVPLDAPNAADRPVLNPGGVVDLASYQTRMAPGSLISIFGRNLGVEAVADSTPLPATLGGVCVTLNNQPIPLVMTSPSQINAQIPPELTANRYPIVVRSIERRLASTQQTVTLSRYSPSVFVAGDGQAAIFHADGRQVNSRAPAKRDEPLTMYAAGLGPTRGGRVSSGQPAPSEPLAITDPVKVFFGDPRYREAEMIVEWSGLAPGFVGLYQINIRVPGARIKGDGLPVTVRVGGVDSPATGPVAPVTFVE